MAPRRFTVGGLQAPFQWAAPFGRMRPRPVLATGQMSA